MAVHGCSPSCLSPDAFEAPFPQRSRPRLLTDAACGGLRPAPASRSRGTYPHLSRRLLRHTEVGDPQHVRRWGMELAIDVIERAKCRLVAHRRSDRLAADDAFETHGSHQKCNRAAGDIET